MIFAEISKVLKRKTPCLELTQNWTEIHKNLQCAVKHSSTQGNAINNEPRNERKDRHICNEIQFYCVRNLSPKQ